jgi:hypothetical protein
MGSKIQPRQDTDRPCVQQYKKALCTALRSHLIKASRLFCHEPPARAQIVHLPARQLGTRCISRNGGHARDQVQVSAFEKNVAVGEAEAPDSAEFALVADHGALLAENVKWHLERQRDWKVSYCLPWQRKHSLCTSKHWCSLAFSTALLSFRAFEVVVQQLYDDSGSHMAFADGFSSDTKGAIGFVEKQVYDSGPKL